jgi:hypothetical protein
MLNGDEIEQVWARLEAEGLSDLKPCLKPQEESGWEVVRIESMEEGHLSYGFRSNYNGLIVDGLPSLELAKAIKACKMATSYADWELERQFY